MYAPAPAMGASAGHGQAVHSGRCDMHKLGIQVLPSPDMMATMDAKDTLCKVTLLSIRSEDMLADYTADELRTGFKKRPAFQLRGMRGHLDHHAATWQLMPFTRCDGVYELEGHAVLSGHIEHGLGRHARTFHQKGVCDWLQEVPGFPAARHQAEQRLVRRGHLDHQTAVWQLMHHTSPWRLASRRRRLFSCAASSRAEARQARACGSPQGLEDTLAYVGKGVCGWLHEDVAFQLRAIKQNRGSSGLRFDDADPAILTERSLI